MKNLISSLAAVAILCAPAFFVPAVADEEPEEVLISIYHVAPGQHLDFLNWMAAREDIGDEVGVPATQWYAHLNGASWDYIAINPATTPEQDRKLDEIAAEKGLKTGFAASLELRHYISRHSDTFAVGPVRAAELIEAASAAD